MINGQQYMGTPLPVGFWNITREQRRKVTSERAFQGFAAAQSSGAYGSCIILCHHSNYACLYVCICDCQLLSIHEEMQIQTSKVVCEHR